MIETELYLQILQEKLPEQIISQFEETHNSVVKKSALHWSEHCTECAMPGCFSTCDLYSPRIDGKCQRFLKGIERIQINNEFYLNKIHFKKWGVFATQGNHILYTVDNVQKQERGDHFLAKLIHMAWPPYVKKKLIKARYGYKKRKIKNSTNKAKEFPDGFLVEIYNPTNEQINVNLTIRNDDEEFRKTPFQYQIQINSGYNKDLIPFVEIDKRINTNMSYRVEMIPDAIDQNTPLYFGITDFVKFVPGEHQAKSSKKVKCVVWDLDNTIWQGILVEDGIDKLTLKEGIVDVLKEIENRGIINSIASKNNHEPAMEALKHFGIDEYFLFPKISWEPKSKGIKEIALDMNVGLNTFFFLDDSAFERREVESVLPQVRVYDETSYKNLLEMEEFQIPVTEESKKRKLFYQNEVVRKQNSEDFEGEYFNFIKSCDINLEIGLMSEKHFERVYELTQRTNQMNFSGKRYKKEDISAIKDDTDLDAYVMNCRDRFGEYGIIGFGVIRKSDNRMIDLMFSCRIQSKRVEHAFITHCLNKYLTVGDFNITYIHTDRNRFSAQVFVDFNFEMESKDGAHRMLNFKQGRTIPNDQIITVKEISI